MSLSVPAKVGLSVAAPAYPGHSRDTRHSLPCSPLLVRRTTRAHSESDNLFQKTIHFTKFSGQAEHLHALLGAVFHLM